MTISVATLVIDIITALAILGIIAIFLLHRRSLKLALIFTALFALYILIIILNDYLGINAPIARGLITLLVWAATMLVIVVYQSDFKVMFFNLTKRNDKSVLMDSDLSDDELRKTVDEIIKACQTMSKSRTGALIVIAPTAVAKHILDTGVELEAVVSASLLEAIFNTRAPFHDGAVIIKGNKALAAGCFLPLSQSQTVAKNLGTRHRAGIGITEESDMLTIIVSEETGIISIAKSGELRRFITPDRLRDILHETLKIAAPTHTRSL